MEEYIEEALAVGHIRPSTSPAAAGFFFVWKKDTGLHPCIDYLPCHYIDDILVYSISLEEHVRHVRAVLSRLQQNHLYVKPEKCEFHRTTITFLGYVISRQGVEMDLTKIQAVTEWPNPTTIKELQWFLGFANFYQRFIQNYSSVSGTFTSLLRGKPSRLSWSDQAQAAFIQLKDSFTTAPILRHPDPEQWNWPCCPNDTAFQASFTLVLPVPGS
ncbi:hypothetical protein QTP86_016504 [Hemibagrus guttatus]|nr:hypothetical protein QTP86_016504 [Hemibagrus guttatus]